MARLTDNIPPHAARTRRHHVAAAVSDMMADLLYYDRKECESLQDTAIEDAIIDGDVSVDEIVEVVREALDYAVEDRRLARKILAP